VTQTGGPGRGLGGIIVRTCLDAELIEATAKSRSKPPAPSTATPASPWAAARSPFR